jgi:hypothetical protein
MGVDVGNLQFVRFQMSQSMEQAGEEEMNLVWEPAAHWVAVNPRPSIMPGTEDPTENFVKSRDLLVKWSMACEEIINLAWTDAAQVLTYDHYRSGTCVRTLHWADAVLTVASGEPEAWEDEVTIRNARGTWPGIKQIVDALRKHHGLPASAFCETISGRGFTNLRRVEAAANYHVAAVEGSPGAFLVRDDHSGSGTLRVVDWRPNLAALEKIIDGVKRGLGVRGSSEQVAPGVKLSPELARIVGPGPMGREDVTKRVWDYIKQQGLQDKANRRLINTDDKLRAIFGGRSQVTMFEMPKLLEQHMG